MTTEQPSQTTDASDIVMDDIQLQIDDHHIEDDQHVKNDQNVKDGENICKYCRQSGGKMITPCMCKDYVCYSCLDTWQKSRKNGKDTCEICKSKYYTHNEFEVGKCLSDYFIYTILFLLNLFVVIGYTGYDLIVESLDKEGSDKTPFGTLVGISFIIGVILIGITWFLAGLFFISVALEEGEMLDIINKKNIFYFLIFNTILQAIPSIICSSILGKSFWNLATMGMGIMGIMVIGLFGACIYGIFRLSKSKYVVKKYANNPDS